MGIKIRNNGSVRVTGKHANDAIAQLKESMDKPKRKINAYICDNLHATITEDLIEGTTPMFIFCKQCVSDGVEMMMASSRMYRVNQTLKATHEWFRPNSKEELVKYCLDNQYNLRECEAHVNAGGLLLRKKGG